jgi:hypothetical protein
MINLLGLFMAMRGSWVLTNGMSPLILFSIGRGAKIQKKQLTLIVPSSLYSRFLSNKTLFELFASIKYNNLE